MAYKHSSGLCLSSVSLHIPPEVELDHSLTSRSATVFNTPFVTTNVGAGRLSKFEL